MGASVLLYRQSPLEFPDSPDSTGHLKPGLPIGHLKPFFSYIDKKNENFVSLGSREAFPFPINDILDLNKNAELFADAKERGGACLLQACLLRRQSEGGQWASAPLFGADARSPTCADDRRNKPTQPPI